jgi:hypothetical protein
MTKGLPFVHGASAALSERQNFHPRRGLQGPDAKCQGNPLCTRRLLSHQVAWAPSATEVDSTLRAHPAVFTAAVVFHDERALSYTLRMNHSSLPSTRHLFSDVDVGTLRLSQEPDTDWKRYYLFANLQLAIDRSLMAEYLSGGVEEWEGGGGGGVGGGEGRVTPLGVHVNVRCS